MYIREFQQEFLCSTAHGRQCRQQCHGTLLLILFVAMIVQLNMVNPILCNPNANTHGENIMNFVNESLTERNCELNDDLTSSGMVWTNFLEDYVLSQSVSKRNSKDLNYMSDMMGPNGPVTAPINYHSSAYKRPSIYITKRIGEAVELEPHMRPPIKQFRPMTNPMQHQVPSQQHQQQQRQQPGFLQQLFGLGGGGGGGGSSSSGSSVGSGGAGGGISGNDNGLSGPSGPTSSLQQQQSFLRPLSLQQTQHHNILQPQLSPTHTTGPPQTFRAVSENDLYLLGAIEKLVYRVDYLESRIRRAEQLIYYLMAGNNQKEVRDPCPNNFTRINDNCYYINSYQKVNWKTANTACKGLNAHLAEFERNSENEEIIAFLLNQPNHRGRDYWLGALNPGLLWIWSNSAKPINPNMNLTSIAMSHENSSNSPPVESNLTENNSNEDETTTENATANESILNNTNEIKGQGRCLRLTYNPTKHVYNYFGQECTSRHHYICEYEDKTLDNKIKKIARELKIFN